MDHITFHTDFDLKIAILSLDLDYEGMLKHYIEGGLIEAGGHSDIIKEVVAVKLPYTMSGKGYKAKKKPLSAAEQREFYKELLPEFDRKNIVHIIVNQPAYYKTLTGSSKASLEAGVLKAPAIEHFPEFQHMKVTFAPNHKMAFFDPVKTGKNIRLMAEAVINDRRGNYTAPGKGIIKHCHYPLGFDQIRSALTWLLDRNCDLTADIEAHSLDAEEAGIRTISFAWNKYEGLAFEVDYGPGIYNYKIRRLLKWFFQLRYNRSFYGARNDDAVFNKTTLKWHNAAYDVTVLIHQLGKYIELGKVTEERDDVFDILSDPDQMDCTQIITYLAVNSCAGNKLSLKEQALEFAGNYAQEDIKDITKIPVVELLEYNLVDSLATWFTFDKNYPIMVSDQQENVYKDVMKPSLKDIIDMQLTGLPVDMDQVKISRAALEKLRDDATDVMLNHPMMANYVYHLKELEVIKLHAKWKKKRTTAAAIDLEFNPGSDIQLAGLLFDPKFMGLPILGRTDAGAPSTAKKHIEVLHNHTKDQSILDFISALQDYKDTAILLSTFIPALENARLAPDGNYYMHGNFKLGGTKSGRLSSNGPNLQNIPSSSRLAKWIKMCIRAPKGWMWVGLDYDSLEDKISALLTKDPNKIKVYTDGYDGHSLRAYSYFGHDMEGIEPDSVASINSIAVKYKSYRQKSKAPTFLLTYGGTFHGLKSNCGFTEEVAKNIEYNYHRLYKVSDQYIADQIKTATNVGYVTCAFGLRLRTPILHQVILGNRSTPAAGKAESRTAGNALGQSWGLLNNRACTEFMNKVRADAYYRENIKVCCQIHDAQYYLIKADANVLKWFNDTLVKAVSWQKDPRISHDKVKLTGTTSVFYPTWAEEHSIPNNASVDDILDICAGIYNNTTI